MEGNARKKKKNKCKGKTIEYGPLVVCKHCAKYTRIIKPHLRYIHGIHTNISEHYCTPDEWKLIKAQKAQELQERERKRMEDPNYLPCGTKLNSNHYIKIIYTPMGGSNKKY